MAPEQTSAVGSTDAAREAWGYLHDLWFSKHNHAHLHRVCDSLGLSPGLMKALLSIEPGEPKPMKVLAAEWRCDASYVTSLVDGLEQRGLAERSIHPTDRRAKMIALTAEGKRTRDALIDRLHEPPAAVHTLTLAEQRTLSRLLGKVVAAAEDADQAEAR